jgi:hypothetical protein
MVVGCSANALPVLIRIRIPASGTARSFNAALAAIRTASVAATVLLLSSDRRSTNVIACLADSIKHTTNNICRAAISTPCWATASKCINVKAA